MIGKSHRLRSTILFSLFIVYGVVLVGRLFYVQCLRHQYYTDLARNQHWRLGRIPAYRGSILDRNYNVLATSVECSSLYGVPRLIRDPVAASIALAPLLQIDPKQLQEDLTGDGWFVWIKRHLTEKEAKAVASLSIPGIEFRPEMKRIYPKGNLLTHVLGLTDLDGRGIEGLELQYDDQLRGRSGWRLTEKDNKRREVLWFRSRDVEAIQGCNLILTMDEVIQDIAEDELEKVFQEYQARWATLLVMEPGSGKILALANRPTCEPSSLARSHPERRRNRAVTDQIEPGSAFKVFPGACALEAGVVDVDTEFFCENGVFWIGGHPLHDHRKHGHLTFYEIVQKSSNIGMAKIGMLLGEEELYRSLRKFGIGSRTGVDLPGEVGGCLHPPQSWSGISLRSITMGHEVSMTPLSLLTAFCALGNGGILLKPQIVDWLETPNGEIVHRFPRQERGRVVSEDTARKMLSVLRGVVQPEGTASQAYISGFEVAGKTGTPQKLDENGRYTHSRHRAIFMGMLPARQPQLALLVVVDEPRPYYYGGVVAAPVFRRVAERIIGYLKLKPVAEGVLL